MKRTLTIIGGIVLFLAIIGILLYILFKPSAHLTVNNGNPFGDTNSGTVTPQSTLESGTGANTAGTVVAPNLIEITSSPVSAGEVAVDIAPTLIPNVPATGSSTLQIINSSDQFTSGDVDVRYIDRESGNVYSYLAITRKLSRVSNKTLPGIQQASWLPDGSMAFVQFLATTDGVSHVDTYALPYDGNGGYFLQQDLDQALVVGSSSVFVLNTDSNSSVGSIASADGSTVNTLFTSPLTSIVARAAGKSIIAVTKATSELDGYAFSLSNGVFTPILGPLRGLTVLPSPSGNQVLYSYTDGSAFHMAVLNLSDNSVTTLPLATLTEKCVWTSDNTSIYCAVPVSMSGNLPDDWYQGSVSFTDQIWRIDLSSRLATLIVDPAQAGKTDIDAVNLTIDPNSQVLIFRNKKDSSLWAYTL